MQSLEHYLTLVGSWIWKSLPGVLLALLTLIVGLWVIRGIVSIIRRLCESRQVDVSLARFFTSFSSVALKVLLVISVISMLGVETTSFIAVLGAAGLAIGLALQGSLSNFAGGVLILLFRPFKVGDYISAQGESGTVDSIQIFNTVLKTPDNKVIIMPNGPLANSNITNYSQEELRRVDMVFGIGYSDDIRKAREVLEAEIAKIAEILAEPEKAIWVSELADSSVNLAVRVWVKNADYWPVYFRMQENVKLAFDANNISIPFPQQDVYMHNVAG